MLKTECLALLSYCHVTEADFFYHVLANLSRLKAGAKYDMDLFGHLRRKRKRGVIPPALGDKIREVNELAAKVGVDTASIFAEIYFKDIRNSVFHADYKGLLELIFEDDLLCGFRTYWPNGSNSEFTRTIPAVRALTSPSITTAASTSWSASTRRSVVHSRHWSNTTRHRSTVPQKVGPGHCTGLTT